MPFKSDAQRKKFIQLEKEGKLKKGTVEKWEKETGDAKLPDKINKNKVKKVREI